MKGKVKSNTCVSYTGRTENRKCLTISEVAADFHVLVILKRPMWISIAHVIEQLDQLFAASRYVTARISHTRP